MSNYKQLQLEGTLTVNSYKITSTRAQVPVYFLNGKFDYRHMIDWTAGDIDCVHTVGPPVPMPEKVILE